MLLQYPICDITCILDAKLNCLKWNPAYNEVLVLVLSTGVVSLMTVKDDVSVPVTKTGIPANTGICWYECRAKYTVSIGTQVC